MPKVHVQSEAVRRNIELFKQIARRFIQKSSSEHSDTCAAVVNRVTGAMRFSNMEELNPKDWKHISINIDLDGHDVSVYEESEKNKAFECNDLEPLAYRIMSETLNLLKLIVEQSKSLKDISQIELEPSRGPVISRDIIHEAWHQLDRIGAEALLKKHALGTYFFRKDHYASVLEKELSIAHRKSIKCVTLTFLDVQQVIRDRTIVKYDDHWLFYNDDPLLSEQKFETVGELLASMESTLKQPLLV